VSVRQAVGTTTTRRPETVQFLRDIVEELKANGFVADALRRANQSGATVGPTQVGTMEILTSKQILDARLDDWRKLAQALHARFLTGDFVTASGLSPPSPRPPSEPATILR